MEFNINDKRYEEFFQMFHKERAYFECHEILEEVWIEETNCTTRKHPAIVLLLIAVAALHWQRENFSGAKKVMYSAYEGIPESREKLEKIGLNTLETEALLRELIEEIEKGLPYREFDIPL